MIEEPREERIEDEPPYREVPPRDPKPGLNDPDIPRGDGDPWPDHPKVWDGKCPDEPRDSDGNPKHEEEQQIIPK